MRVYGGADLGGTHFRVGLRAPGGESLLARASVPAEGDWSPEALVEAAAALLGGLGVGGEHDLAGLGFASTGDIDPEAGSCHSMRRFPGLEGAPLGPLLSARLAAPVRLLNDGLCAALAEARLGAGRGVGDFVVVTAGTGIGGGVVLGGRLLPGARGRVGRVGHMVVDASGPALPTCHCGLAGCWQALAARGGLLHHAVRLGAGEGETPESLAARAAAGDPVARAAWAEAGRWLGVGLANLAKLFAPEVVLVGGGLAAGCPAYLEAARAEVERLAVKAYQRVPVRPAALGAAAGLLGATLLAEA